MRFLLLISCIFLLQACEQQKTDTAKKGGSNFAESQIKVYNDAQKIDDIVKSAKEKQDNEMIEEGL
jgi:hypothetical protein